jgi:uncharacterized membrane protein
MPPHLFENLYDIGIWVVSIWVVMTLWNHHHEKH